MAIVLLGLGLVVLAATLFVGLVEVRHNEQRRLDELDTDAARAELARRASRRRNPWRAE